MCGPKHCSAEPCCPSQHACVGVVDVDMAFPVVWHGVIGDKGETGASCHDCL